MKGKNWLVLLAGLPEGLSNEFDKKLHKIGLEEIEIISFPIHNSQIYEASYIQKIYSQFYNSVLGRFGTHSFDSNFQGAVLLFFDHKQLSPSDLISAFAIETTVVRLSSKNELFDVNISPNRRNRIINSIFPEIRNSIDDAKNKIRILKKELISNDNRTPFLLPFKYFNAENLQNLPAEIVDAGCSLVSEKVLGLRNKYGRSIRQVSFGRSKLKHFINSKGLVFKSPGRRTRHGFPRNISNSNHLEQCFVRGVLRFGVPYDAKFHYDCENENQRNVPRDWQGCHGQVQMLPSGRAHVNIAPNEFVR